MNEKMKATLAAAMAAEDKQMADGTHPMFNSSESTSRETTERPSPEELPMFLTASDLRTRPKN